VHSFPSMRFTANPLVLAVALGLLGPVALDEEEDGAEAAESVSAESAVPAPAGVEASARVEEPEAR
jgi:hypothetical protein